MQFVPSCLLQHSDQELWSVLERCHLRLAVRDLGGWSDTYMFSPSGVQVT